MKLNDTLITSPDDFARHFSFVEFWIKHDLFLRDLNPERIFYATDRQRQLYKVVEAWLKTEESETPEPPAYVFDETARAIIRTTVSEPDEAPCTLPVQINGDAVPAMKSVTGTNAARTAGILALYELAEKPLDITDLKTAFAEVRKSINPKFILRFLSDPVTDAEYSLNPYLKAYEAASLNPRNRSATAIRFFPAS